MATELRPRRALTSAIATTALVVAMIVGGAGAAQADTPTSVAFDGAGSTVDFGSAWTIKLTVTSPSGLLDTQSGTVDIMVEGIAGPFAAAVPLYFGGETFVTPPSGSPLLPAGEHRVSAIFRPAAGSGLATSQTQTDYVLTVSALALDTRSVVVEVLGDAGTPYLDLRTTGPYVDALGVPAGTWAVTVVDGSTQVLSTNATQQAGATTPIRVSLAEVARPGRTLGITSVFTPDPAVAGGMTVTQPAPLDYKVAGLTPLEFLATGVAVPWWLLLLLVLVVAGAVAWLIVVLVRRSRAKRAEAEDAEAAPWTTPDSPTIEDSSAP